MSKIEPWQAELLINMEKSAKLVFTTARQTGKSDWSKLYQQFMNQPKKRFQLASSPASTSSYMLLIEDYMWWTDNEREILNWMAEQLPRGIEHQQGMVLTFDSEQDRMMFLLRWS